MKNLKLKIIFIVFAIFLSPKFASASGLTESADGLSFGYRYLSTEFYGAQTIALSGLTTIEPHQFYYDFEYLFGRGRNNLATIGAGYAYKDNNFWVGLGLSSASDAIFSRLNLVDFDVFFAYKVFQKILQYNSKPDGEASQSYMHLYIGIDFSSERILLDGYPLPVIRYEYSTPKVFLILGFPLTNLTVFIADDQRFIMKYVPVLNLSLGYQYDFDEYNTLGMFFEIENKKYRLYDTAADVYYAFQTKYYTQTMFLKLQYTLNINDVFSINPYFDFVVGGSTYEGKIFSEELNRQNMGLGYAFGVNLQVNFY